MFESLLKRLVCLRSSPVVLSALLLSACAVGPNYQAPAISLESAYARQGETGHTARVPEADVQFWRNWGDPFLEGLVADTLRANHDIRIALSRYEQARALTYQAELDRYPTPSASGELSHQRVSAAQAPGLSRTQRDGDSHQLSLAAVWELDFFGRVRRSIESQKADTEAYAADLAGVQVAVVAEVIDAYFRLRGLQERLRVARDNESNQADTLRLIHVLFQEGRGTSLDVDRAGAQLALTRSRVPALQAQAEVTANRIAVLTGRQPAVMANELDRPVVLPIISVQVNAGVPGELLRRRPDIAAAERRLAGATARIGVATADLFPRFTLGGLIGTQALGVNALFQRDSETRLISLGVGGSFLDVARVRSRIAAANLEAAQSLEMYQQTVLAAMEEAENALLRLTHTQTEQSFLEQAVQASRRAASTARLRFEDGMVSVLEVLEAERVRLDAEERLAQSTTEQARALVGIYKTLAGGWPQLLPDLQQGAIAQR